jgi:hypothetical protein
MREHNNKDHLVALKEHGIGVDPISTLSSKGQSAER